MEPKSTQVATKRATWILNAKCNKADLKCIVKDNASMHQPTEEVTAASHEI
jgi:hypothetical protein